MSRPLFQQTEQGFMYLNGVRYAHTMLPRALDVQQAKAKKKKLTDKMSPILLKKARKLSQKSDESLHKTIDNDILKDKKAKLMAMLEIDRFHHKYKQSHPEYFTVTEEERAAKRIQYQALVDRLLAIEIECLVD